jgi:hypothetical protein
MWKQEYTENRRKKAEADPAYKERLLQNAARGARTPEENREYMRAYYAANKEKWNYRTPEWREAWNAKRRAQYAANTERREAIKAQVRSYNARNPLAKRKNALKAYGIDHAEYQRLLDLQGGGCAICGSTETKDSRGIRLHVDHCHATGKVRGILCAQCNMGLGKFHDEPARLELAAAYLRRTAID